MMNPAQCPQYVEVCLPQFEIRRRIPLPDTRYRADVAAHVVRAWLKKTDQEWFCLLTLTQQDRMRRLIPVAMTSGHCLSLQPEDIFRYLPTAHATRLVLAHTHPSGDVRPSGADLLTTTQVIRDAVPYQYEIVDHLIVTTREWYSMRDKGHMG